MRLFLGLFRGFCGGFSLFGCGFLFGLLFDCRLLRFYLQLLMRPRILLHILKNLPIKLHLLANPNIPSHAPLPSPPLPNPTAALNLHSLALKLVIVLTSLNIKLHFLPRPLFDIDVFYCQHSGI